METIGLKPGTLLRHNSYRIEKILGQGGFGITYLATDLSLERYVAIKEFYPKDYCQRDSSSSDTDTLNVTGNKELIDKLKAKFIKEARNIAKFDYPGIIKIHSAFEENSTAYYVMDYIKGKTLSEIVKENGPIPVEKAVKYIEKIGASLSFMHKHHVNHLDVKPANVMVRENFDEPVLIDFGLSKQYDSDGLQTSTTLTGISHGYAPIEQYSPKGVQTFSPKPDIYSLGATLYFLVSGQVPPYATEIAGSGLTFPENFPAELKQPVSHAMSAKTDRHETIEEFISELKKALPSENLKEESLNVIPEPATYYQVNPGHQNYDYDGLPGYENENNNTKKWIWGSLIAIILIAAFVIVFFIGKGSVAQNELADNPTPMKVSQMPYQTTLGECLYSGEIDSDSLPNGKGMAIFESGEAKEYHGDWKHGNMDGNARYTHKSGDIFEGTFKDNQYNEGKYTVTKSGEYFEGKFVNGEPFEGKWYNKDGRVTHVVEPASNRQIQ